MKTPNPDTTHNYSRRRQIAGIIVLILLLGCIVGTTYTIVAHKPTKQPPSIVTTPAENTKIQPGYYSVSNFFDGDTFEVNMEGNTEKIRLIGVDTPETHDPRKDVQCFGEEASKFTKALIGNNPVRLEADPLNTNRDRYNRLLRYAYLPDGRQVNAEIIQQGYGFAYIIFPFEQKEIFKSYQQEAQNHNRGLWATCPTNISDKGQYSSGATQ